MPLVRRTYDEVLLVAWQQFYGEWTLHDITDAASVEWTGTGPYPTTEEIVASAENAWLITARVEARRRVDVLAEEKRLEYLTPGAGQAMVYLEKQREARAWLAAGGDNGSPMARDYPLLAASVGVDRDPMTGDPVETMDRAAEGIMLVAGQWATVASEIEQRRLRAKNEISTAETIEAVEAVMAKYVWVWPE